MTNANTHAVRNKVNSIVRIDRGSAIIAALLVFFQASALALVERDVIGRLTMVTDSTRSSPVLSGVGIAVWVVVETMLLLGGFMLYRRLSEWWQDWIKTLLRVGGSFLVVAYVSMGNPLFMLFGVTIAMWLLRDYIPDSPYYWMYHNTMAVCSGVLGLVLLGYVLPPAAVLIALVALLAWDAFAVFKSDVMAGVVDLTSNLQFPAFLIIPNTWKVPKESLFNVSVENGAEFDGRLVGVGDFIFPGLVAVTVAIELGTAIATPVIAPIVGTVLAAFVLAKRLETAESGLPALLWLNTGAIVGFLVGVVGSAYTFSGIIGVI